MNAAPILYLCGPMTGLPDFNYPAFHEAARQLRAAGFKVVNPAETTIPRTAPWISHMRKDIADMVNTCDAVATLPGCESSRGAMVEIYLAKKLGWTVYGVNDWLHLARIIDKAEKLMDTPN
jgi:hypothetical protein